jgi:thiamine kinase-like enzyme
VLGALGRLGEELTPCPWPDAPAAVSELRSFFSGWRALAAAPPDDLPRWVYDDFERLIGLEDTLVAALDAGSTLCHIDVRSDNILLASDRVVFVDWNWAAVGPRWLDTALLGVGR